MTFERGRGGAGGDGEPNQFVAAARAEGIEVDVIDERFRFDTGVVGQLRRIAGRRAPDIIETHMIKSHFLVKLSGLGRRSKWVAYHHGYTSTDLKMLVYNRFNRWSLPSADRVVTVASLSRAQLARSGVARAKISVRKNSIGPAARVGAEEVRRSDAGSDERGRALILSVGRLSREKGHADLVEALESCDG